MRQSHVRRHTLAQFVHRLARWGDVCGLVAELHKTARGRTASERDGQTLDATGLVHEAWRRLTAKRGDGEAPHSMRLCLFRRPWQTSGFLPSTRRWAADRGTSGTGPPPEGITMFAAPRLMRIRHRRSELSGESWPIFLRQEFDSPRLHLLIINGLC